MSCNYHVGLESVANCCTCGEPVCMNCLNATEGYCLSCYDKQVQDFKKSLIIRYGVSIVVFLVGFLGFLIGGPGNFRKASFDEFLATFFSALIFGLFLGVTSLCFKKVYSVISLKYFAFLGYFGICIWWFIFVFAVIFIGWIFAVKVVYEDNKKIKAFKAKKEAVNNTKILPKYKV